MSASANSNPTQDTAARVVAVEVEPRQRTTAANIGFVPQLESLRGIGALMVAAVHAAQSRAGPKFTLLTDPRSWSDPMWSALFWLYRTICNGQGALMCFFVLSGFVLASSIERGPKDIWPSMRHFFTGRIFRIYPVIITSVLLFCIIFWLTGVTWPRRPVTIYRPESIIRNMLLIDWNIVGVMWSLQVEVLAIPLIFAVTLGQRRWGAKFSLALAVLLLALTAQRTYGRLIEPGAFLTFYYIFVFGIATHRVGPQLMAWVGKKRVPWMIAVIVVLFVLPRAMLPWGSRWARFSECMAAVGLISLLVYGGKTTLARVLNWPVWRFYGRISYSFYLLHPLTFLIIWKIPDPLSRLLDAGVPGFVVALALAICSILAITPLAWLSWRFIEIPAIALGRRLSPDRRNASPYVGPRGRVLQSP
jgi:peptidoglycan/LPS O-acetylase OafA/YrhL